MVTLGHNRKYFVICYWERKLKAMEGSSEPKFCRFLHEDSDVRGKHLQQCQQLSYLLNSKATHRQANGNEM